MSQPHGLSRRQFLKSTAVGAVGATLGAPAVLRAQGKTGTVRVWGEPGPYGGVAVDGMNEWAQKNAPGLKFAIETIPWSDVYAKLMTDLAAGRPAHCISVESPIAFQLMAEGLLEPVDDLVDKIGRDRLIPGMKWEYWGAWKGKQYVIPAHHQSHLLVVRHRRPERGRRHQEPGGVELERPARRGQGDQGQDQELRPLLRARAHHRH